MCSLFYIIANTLRAQLLQGPLVGTVMTPVGRESSRNEVSSRPSALPLPQGNPASARNEVSSAHITRVTFPSPLGSQAKFKLTRSLK